MERPWLQRFQKTLPQKCVKYVSFALVGVIGLTIVYGALSLSITGATFVTTGLCLEIIALKIVATKSLAAFSLKMLLMDFTAASLMIVETLLRPKFYPSVHLLETCFVKFCLLVILFLNVKTFDEHDDVPVWVSLVIFLVTLALSGGDIIKATAAVRHTSVIYQIRTIQNHRKHFKGKKFEMPALFMLFFFISKALSAGVVLGLFGGLHYAHAKFTGGCFIVNMLLTCDVVYEFIKTRWQTGHFALPV